MGQLAQQSQHPVNILNKLLQSLKWHAKQHAKAPEFQNHLKSHLQMCQAPSQQHLQARSCKLLKEEAENKQICGSDLLLTLFCKSVSPCPATRWGNCLFNQSVSPPYFINLFPALLSAKKHLQGNR